ncbi:MAG: DUF4105 domain-containing protein [Saprospiraceae bacterium]
MRFKPFICLLFIIGISLKGFANEKELPIISILTCAPGQQIYSIYGHNALRIRYSDQRDMVLNYGTFDFNTPNFTLKFLRGKLPYRLSLNSYQDFIYEYNMTQRGVVEQVLDLDSFQLEKMMVYLEENLKTENREYKYDFFYDNCATRIYDVLQFSTTEQIDWSQNNTNNYTFRQIIKHYQRHFPWTSFGIDLIIGSRADKVTSIQEQMFIPDFVKKHVDFAKINNHSIVKSSATLLSFKQPEITSFYTFFIGPLFLFLCFLVFEIYLFYNVAVKKQKLVYPLKIDKLWFVFLLFLTIVMTTMWFFTDHIPTRDNWNLVWTISSVFYFFKPLRQSKLYVVLTTILLSISLVNAFNLPLLPQYFHPVVGILCVITLLKIYREQVILNAIRNKV